jgi:hypothetical protein
VIKLSNILSEVAYDGNMGFHEMYLFYGEASDSQVDKLEKLILDKKFREAWKLVQNVVGVKLKGKEFESVDKVKGGLSDGMSLEDIANKHKVDIDDLNDEYKMGIKVEREHTSDSTLAAEIAKDHLYEDPKYYSKLKKIEENLKKWFGGGKWGGKGGGGWDRYSTTGEVMGKCGDAKEGEPYSACLSKEAASKLGKKGIASFVRRKRDAQKKGGDAKKGGEKSDGDKPIRVSWDPKGKKKFNPPK